MTTATAAAEPIPNFIGGRWMPSAVADALDVTSPATGERLGRVGAGRR